MRQISLFIIFTSILSANTFDIKKIDQKLSALAKQVMETKDKNIRVSYDPFHPQSTKTDSFSPIKKPKIHFIKNSNKPKLSMILNKKAFINGKWYKENEKISDFLIYKINQDTVFLKKRNKIIKLTLSKTKSMLVTKEEL